MFTLGDKIHLFKHGRGQSDKHLFGHGHVPHKKHGGFTDRSANLLPVRAIDFSTKSQNWGGNDLFFVRPQDLITLHIKTNIVKVRNMHKFPIYM